MTLPRSAKSFPSIALLSASIRWPMWRKSSKATSWTVIRESFSSSCPGSNHPISAKLLGCNGRTSPAERTSMRISVDNFDYFKFFLVLSLQSTYVAGGGKPIQSKAVLVTEDARFSALTVNTTRASTVAFIGTDDGRLLKVKGKCSNLFHSTIFRFFWKVL